MTTPTTTPAKHTRTKPKWPHSAVVKMSAHPCGQWTKKYAGKVKYFGPWADPDAALANWRARDALIRAGTDAITKCPTIREMFGAYLDERWKEYQRGEIRLGTYRKTCKQVDIANVALGSDKRLETIGDAELTRVRETVYEQTQSPTARRVTLTVIKAALQWISRKYAVKLDTTALRKPSDREVRRARNAKPPRHLSVGQVRMLADEVPCQQANKTKIRRACTMLAMCCGINQRDIAELRVRHLDVQQDGSAILEHERSKTAIVRRAWIWPEAVAAVRDASVSLAAKSPDPDDLLLTTRNGNPLVYDTEKAKCDSVGLAFRRNAASLGWTASFGDLRKTFQAVAETMTPCDSDAIEVIMGRVPTKEIRLWYNPRMFTDRLIAVGEHVRHWYLGNTSETRTPSEARIPGGVRLVGTSEQAA